MASAAFGQMSVEKRTKAQRHPRAASPPDRDRLSIADCTYPSPPNALLLFVNRAIETFLYIICQHANDFFSAELAEQLRFVMKSTLCIPDPRHGRLLAWQQFRGRVAAKLTGIWHSRTKTGRRNPATWCGWFGRATGCQAVLHATLHGVVFHFLGESLRPDGILMQKSRPLGRPFRLAQGGAAYSAACFRGGSSAPESWISATW